jgi:hypothetical protein
VLSAWLERCADALIRFSPASMFAADAWIRRSNSLKAPGEKWPPSAA